MGPAEDGAGRDLSPRHPRTPLQHDPRHHPAREPLLTDLYQLTMAYGYWRAGMAEQEAVFHLFFRRNPFGSGFSVACGLDYVRGLLDDFRFADDDLAYLRGLTGGDGRPLFDPTFLDELGRTALACDVDAIPEGTVVFPHEPLLRLRGPLLQCQLLETPLLNAINFQTLVATKAARLRQAAGEDSIVEFGLRRAQGPDGGLAASRAAYVGGCDATSNLLAGKVFGVPVRGTHAHSWVMCFDDEREAFAAYARALPNNCVFLVDTYDTLQGVRHAIDVGRELRASGHELAGIRLDSGDLAELSVGARRLLDDAGFAKAAIVASDELDEYRILELKRRGAAVTVWGIGTRLATAYDQPALGGVYKLGALRAEDGSWQRKVKLSDTPAKTSIPGVLQVRRFDDGATCAGDVIFDLELGAPEAGEHPSLAEALAPVTTAADAGWRDLLEPIYRAGRAVATAPALDSVRERARAELARLPAPVRDLGDPTPYPVALERRLWKCRNELIARARQAT